MDGFAVDREPEPPSGNDGSEIPTATASDLHRAVRRCYRLAMAGRSTEREAFDCALALLVQWEPQADRAARRMVARMLANEPGLSAAAKEPPMTGFGSLLERQIPALRRYARALLRDPAKADDLVQSCLARAIAKQQLWQPGSDLRAWLFTMLHNLHIADFRRSRRQQADAELAISSAAAAFASPDARLELRDLDRAIANLPEHQRQAVLLIGLEGFSYEAAAAILAVPTGTVRSRLGRARITIRSQLYRPSPHQRAPGKSGIRTPPPVASGA